MNFVSNRYADLFTLSALNEFDDMIVNGSQRINEALCEHIDICRDKMAIDESCPPQDTIQNITAHQTPKARSSKI